MTPLDPDEGYLPEEALCPVHNLTFNRALGACPHGYSETSLIPKETP